MKSFFFRYSEQLLSDIMWLSGADPGFFLGGGALVSCSTSTPINHIVFFLQNTSCIRKPQVISGGGGGCAPPAPSPRSAPDSTLRRSTRRSFACTPLQKSRRNHRRSHVWAEALSSIRFKEYYGMPSGHKHDPIYSLSIHVYSYFEKGCRKKCVRDNPER